MKGAKGFGRVFLRPRSQYWWVAFTYRGREIRESSEATTKQGAVDFLKQRLAEIHGQTYVGRAAKDVTVADLLDGLQRTYRIEGRASLRTVKGHVDAWGAVLGDEKAVNVDRPVLDRVVEEWQAAGRAPATIRKRLASLHRAFVLAREARQVASIPAFPRVVVHNARQGFCEWATFRRLLAALPDDGLRDYVEWAARTGMRKGEIAKLTWQGYDRETGVVRLPGKDAKTGQPRRIVLAGPLKALIARRLAVRRLDCPLIFWRPYVGAPTPRLRPGTPAPIAEFRKTWTTACKAAGVPGLRFHDLRRTALRNMIRAGVSQTVAMRISGHQTDAIFRRYDITSDTDLREAMEKTAEYVDGLPATATVEPLAREGVSG
ncbi:MAG: site-specific integrase [Candidatus Binatia bacterium]